MKRATDLGELVLEAGVADGTAVSTSALITSLSFHTTRPSIPPSTLIHSREIRPAARCDARNAIARATS